METDIERWLSFAGKVESSLHIIDNDVYSDSYISGISNLLNELRSEAALALGTSPLEKQNGYFKANKLVQQLRNTAHFAHHA